LVIQIPYPDPFGRTRRVRKVQVKPIASTAAVFWYDNRGRFRISLERPNPIRRFVEHPIDPPIPEGAKRAGRWERGATVQLGADGGFAEGFYRIKELAESGVIVIPEHNVTAAIAQRLNLPKQEIGTTERTLRKGDLVKLFPKP
jgi:hypothetical protein